MVRYPVDFNLIVDHIQTHLGTGGYLTGSSHPDVNTLILILPPNETRNYATYITIGMSHKPMFVLPDMPDYVAALNRDGGMQQAMKNNYAELVLKLPPDWPIPSMSSGLKNDDFYWPIHRMLELSDYVHEENTFLKHGHTYGYDKTFTFAKNTKLAGWLFIHPPNYPKKFAKLEVNSTKIISFMQLIPLYIEELLFAEEHSSEELIKRLKSAIISDSVDINRPNVCLT